MRCILSAYMVIGYAGYAAKIDIIQGTLAKAYGAIGGYIAANHYNRHNQINCSRFYLYYLPDPYYCSLASIRHLRNSDIEKKTHRMVVEKVKNMFKNAKINYFKNNSHIILIIIGDPVKTRQASEMLLKN